MPLILIEPHPCYQTGQPFGLIERVLKVYGLIFFDGGCLDEYLVPKTLQLGGICSSCALGPWADVAPDGFSDDEVSHSITILNFNFYSPIFARCQVLIAPAFFCPTTLQTAKRCSIGNLTMVHSL
jgi:hypothetical protein